MRCSSPILFLMKQVSKEFRAGIGYLVGESWHTVAQHILQVLEKSWQLHLEDQQPLQASHYLQKQIAREEGGKKIKI